MAKTQRVKDVMTASPVTVSASAPIIDAARAMRENDIGDLIVLEDGAMCGIVTDRDIVVHGVAEGADLRTSPVNTICSKSAWPTSARHRRTTRATRVPGSQEAATAISLGRAVAK